MIVKVSNYPLGVAAGKPTVKMDCNGHLGHRDRRHILIAGLVYCLWWPMLGSVHAAERKRFTVDIKGGHVAKDKRTLRVTEGDNVVIQFTSDRILTLHLHGIDMEVTVGPGKPSVMRFDATVAGRFPVEAHGKGAHAGLVYVEVYPR